MLVNKHCVSRWPTNNGGVWVRHGAHAGVKQSQWGPGEVSADAGNWIGFRLIGHTPGLTHCHWNMDHWQQQEETTSRVDTGQWILKCWWCVSLCRPDLHNNAATHYHFTLNQSDDWFEVNINWVGLYYYDNSAGQRNVWGFSVKLIIHHCLVLTGRHPDPSLDQSEGRISSNWPIRGRESVQVLAPDPVPGWC